VPPRRHGRLRGVPVSAPGPALEVLDVERGDGGVSAREVLAELDRLAISIFYRPLGGGPARGSTSVWAGSASTPSCCAP
jgi:hypothetical protein